METRNVEGIGSHPDPGGPADVTVTIGITCFNAADTIERAVKSALAQDWPNLEIIVADDGSSDGSRALLASLRSESPAISIIEMEKNEGYAAALNAVIRAAKGEFIAIFDDDDASDPQRIRKQLRRIEDYAAAHRTDHIFCYTNRFVVKVGEAAPDHVSVALGAQAPEPHGAIVADYILGVAAPNSFNWGMGMFGSCTLMVARKHLQALGGFDPSFKRCAEWDLAIRAALGEAHFVSVNEPLVTQYKTLSTDKSQRKGLEYRLALRRKHEGYLESRRLYAASVATVEASIAELGGRRVTARLLMLWGWIRMPVGLSARKLWARLRGKRPVAVLN